MIGYNWLVYNQAMITVNAELILYKPWSPKGFIQFEIIINVLVSSFWFIWIHMLWVYGHYKYFYSYSSGIAFSRQNLTSTDVIFWRLKWSPFCKGWSGKMLLLACITLSYRHDSDAKSEISYKSLNQNTKLYPPAQHGFRSCDFQPVSNHLYPLWSNSTFLK